MFKSKGCFFGIGKSKKDDVQEIDQVEKKKEDVAGEKLEVIQKKDYWKHRPYLESHADLTIIDKLDAEKEITLVKQIDGKRYRSKTKMSDLSDQMRKDRFEADSRLVPVSKDRDEKLQLILKKQQQISRNIALIKQVKTETGQLRSEVRCLSKEISKLNANIDDILMTEQYRKGIRAESFFVCRDDLPKDILHVSSEIPKEMSRAIDLGNDLDLEPDDGDIDSFEAALLR